MKIALVQLSDIHLRADANMTVSEAENPALKRADGVARAVNSVCQGVSYGVIVVSGDTAFSGKEVEYQHGRVLIERMRSWHGALI